MSSSGASASAAVMQRHQEQRRADTSALVDAARGQRQMPELPPYVPEFDLAFMSQMLGGGAVRSEPEDPATGDDETIMQEAAVDVALQLLTDDGGLQALLASDEPSAERVALEGADDIASDDIASDPCFSRLAVHLSARHLTLRRPAMDGPMELAELHRTIQLRSPGLNALSLRRYQTARILHASLHRWLD